MRKLTKRLALMLALMAIAIGISSCEKIDELTADPNDVKSINAVYSVDLSQTWFDYFNITVTYYDEHAQPQTLQIFSHWDYTISLPPKKAPRNFVLTVSATPREDHPSLDNVVPITFSQNIKADFFAYRYDGSIYNNIVHDITPVSNSNTGTTTYTYESSFKDFFNRGPRTIFSFTKSWDGTY